MKALSIKQPYASFLVSGVKHYETRTWPAPSMYLGQRIAIVSSKALPQPKLLATMAEAGLRTSDHPLGMVLGIATLSANIQMTAEFIEGLSPTERLLGFYEVGNWAWRFEDPEPLAVLVPLRGMLGFYNWEPIAESIS